MLEAVYITWIMEEIVFKEKFYVLRGDKLFNFKQIIKINVLIK